MIDLKTLSVVAAASAALMGFSASHLSAETAKAPLELAQTQSGSSSTGMGSNRGGEAVNPNAVPSGGSSSTAPRAAGSDQCAQISDPRSRQDCMQRHSDLRSGQPVGNNPIGSGSGVTNRGSGMH